jgi:acylphosphatase
MKEWYVDFQGSIKVYAETRDEAKRKFFDIIYNTPVQYAEIDSCELEEEEEE